MFYTSSWPICTPCFTQAAEIFVSNDFTSFYNFIVLVRNCSDSVIFSVFHFTTNIYMFMNTSKEADLFLSHVLHKKLTYLYAMLYTRSCPICKQCFTKEAYLFVCHVLHKKLTYLYAMFYTRSWPNCEPCFTREVYLFVRHALHKKFTYLYAMFYTRSWSICHPCFPRETDLFVSHVLHKKLIYL